MKPLTAFMLSALCDLRRDPRPRQEFNSGVATALEDRGLVETYLDKTPYRTTTGHIQWLRINEAGLAALAATKP